VILKENVIRNCYPKKSVKEGRLSQTPNETEHNRKTPSPHLRPYQEALLIGGITLLAFALRAYGLSRESAWFDELLSLGYLDLPSVSDFLTQRQTVDPAMVPAYFVIEYYWAKWIGDSLTSVRFLSVLFGTASIPLIFLVGRRIYGAGAGLIAALCLSLSLPHIYYSQEVRMYSFYLLLVLMSAYTLLKALELRNQLSWICHYLINVLMLCTFLLAPLFLFAEFAFLLCLGRNSIRTMIRWTLAHAALAVPWYIWVASLNYEKLYRLSKCFFEPNLAWIKAHFLFLVGGRIVSNPSPAPTGQAEQFWFMDRILALIIFTAVIGFCFREALKVVRVIRTEAVSHDRHTLAHLVFLVVWATFPMLVLTVLSFAWKPCLLPRYILPMCLGMCLLLGASVMALPGKPFKFIVILIITFIYLFLFVSEPKPLRTDWRSFGERVRAEGQPTDVIVVFTINRPSPLEYNAPFLKEQIISAHTVEEIRTAETFAFTNQRDFWLGPLNLGDQNAIMIEKHLSDYWKADCSTVEVFRLRGKGFIHARHPE